MGKFGKRLFMDVVAKYEAEMYGSLNRLRHNSRYGVVPDLTMVLSSLVSTTVFFNE